MSALPQVAGYVIQRVNAQVLRVTCQKCGETWVVRECKRGGLKQATVSYFLLHQYSQRCQEKTLRL